MSTPQQRANEQAMARQKAINTRKEVAVPHETNMRYTPAGMIRVNKAQRKGSSRSATWTTDSIESARRWLELAEDILNRGGTVPSGPIADPTVASPIGLGVAPMARPDGRTLGAMLVDYQANRYLDHTVGRSDLTARAGGTLSGQQLVSDDRIVSILSDERYGLGTKPTRKIVNHDVNALLMKMRADNKSSRDQDQAVSMLNTVLKQEADGAERPRDWPFAARSRLPASSKRRLLPARQEGLSFKAALSLMAFLPVQIQAVVVLALVMALRFSEILGLYLGDLVLPDAWRAWAGAVRSAAATGSPLPDELIDAVRRSVDVRDKSTWAHLTVKRQRIPTTVFDRGGKPIRVRNAKGKVVRLRLETVTGRLKTEASKDTLPIPPTAALWLWWYMTRFHAGYDPFRPNESLAQRLFVIDPIPYPHPLPNHQHTEPPAPDGLYRHSNLSYVRSKFNAGRRLLGIEEGIPPLDDWNSPHHSRRSIGWFFDVPPAEAEHKPPPGYKALWLRHAGPPLYSSETEKELRLMACAAYVEELIVARVDTLFAGEKGPQRGAWTDTPIVDCSTSGTHLTHEQVMTEMGLDRNAVHRLVRRKDLAPPTRAWVADVPTRSPRAVYERRDVERLKARRTPPEFAMLLAEAAIDLDYTIESIRRLGRDKELKLLDGAWVVPGKGRVHLVARSNVRAYANRENLVIVLALMDGGPATAAELYRGCRKRIPGRVPKVIRRMERAGTIARLSDGRYHLTVT